ncbi:DNA replication/repair protein RecF [Collinsella sp. zg1085]|uniref:DNA replication/repair protein RecF n=1 Tax=Collinsella sp. zg1085 TaxID=2844380 RepID=UPI001C0B96B8|nr:DNA replication/repair protein RecF [Collinsella sp. zg1085]QWT17605.1 DNA replication/repair protein RecF [Collinsella sp. zg1085]
MPLYARELRVHNFRSYVDMSLELNSGLTILVGHNAAGKTNLVEALQLLTAGQSFRKPSPSELINEDASSADIRLELIGDGRHLDLGLEISPERRRFLKNGKYVKTQGIRGILPSVLFCPDHLDMIKRSASTRRETLDDFGCQLNQSYAQLVSTYKRGLEQRNKLLRNEYLDHGLLEAWNESIVQSGAALIQHRTALLQRIEQYMHVVYAYIAPSETMQIRYRNSFLDTDDTHQYTREELIEHFYQALVQTHTDELRRGLTLVGPHKDEIEISINGRLARSFGSQGQQRSLVLAWKIAELEVTKDILGYSPLLLLDDVMSELDEKRRSALAHFIQDEVQTVITTTNLGYFQTSILERAQVVNISHDNS